MSDLRICRICLRTEAKGYKFQQFQLKYYYEEVIALKVSDDGLPQWFCYECATMLHKFHKFKEKCYLGQKVLKEMLWKGPITYEAIYKIDRKDILESPLGTITVTDRTKSFNIVDSEKKKYIKQNEIDKEALDKTDKDITDTLYVTGEDLLKQDINNANQNVHNSIEESSNGIEDESEPHSPISVVVDDKSNVVKLKCDDINTVKNKDKVTSISLKELNKHFSENNWKIVHLTEEEAVNEFRKKAEDPKYLESAYKCRDCFKGFSKKDMLNRHVQSRHSEELGSHECRICRMRFKWRCHLRKHLPQHYTEYHCLRCQTVFRLETSALLHEEYHSGTTKKCAYCNEEFSHMTTYYSHVRTHRSAHVCATCGASFVSGAGLLHHRARIHRDARISSDDDDDASQTFCDKCNIRFDTHKAYEEHLFHSNMHTELIKTEKEDDISLNKKILGKRLRDKITKELRKCDTDMEVIPVKSKRRKKIKRKHRKPSTCYQCGQEFPTQRACMQHHVTSHAGSPYHAPHERYICELCGASLAPGSVSVHQNMHSREKLHACDTCGKLFHSSVSLKRHTVTHTGEKPFGCPLCDKRFTQSNSMKLHYRTFHLKQPYPKRIRKKKKDEPSQTEKEDTYEEDSSSLPEPGIDANIPGLQAESGNVHVVSDVHVEMGDENMHYLTLS